MINKFIFLIILFFTYDVFSQVIGGNVTDSISQTGIANAKVLISNVNSGYTDSVFTNASGNWNYNLSTAISDNDLIPTDFIVAQNYPNPFNPSTTIEFILPQSGFAQVSIHNILGQLVDSREKYLNAGSYSVVWDANGSAGVYFYTIKFDNRTITNKMILLDGGNGKGLSEIHFGSKTLNYTANKSGNLQVLIAISKFAYVSKTINASINGGEFFETRLNTIHHNARMIDLHNDVLERMVDNPSYHLGTLNTIYHTDIPRLQKGGVDIQFFSVWVSPSGYDSSLYFDQSQVMMNLFNNELSINPGTIGQARNPAESVSLNNNGKIAAVIGVEGGHTIENSLTNLASLYHQGMRYMTITWNNSTSWAVAAADTRTTTVGLSEFGKTIIRAMDSLGVIIDVSHTGIKTIQDIIQVTTNPIIATHSGVRKLRNHTRNLYDSQIIDIANSGGVIGVVFYPPFLTTSTANIDTVIKHIDYIKNLVGIDYVAIGSDFDGIEVTPIGLEDVSKFPALTFRLLERGYSQQDVEKILGGNFMRVFEQVCGSKKSLSKK